MEVEVKLHLPDAAAHQSLSDLLAPFHRRILLQENVFFDGDRAELSSRLAVLRSRFYGPDPPSSCVVSPRPAPPSSTASAESRTRSRSTRLPHPRLGQAGVAPTAATSTSAACVGLGTSGPCTIGKGSRSMTWALPMRWRWNGGAPSPCGSSTCPKIFSTGKVFRSSTPRSPSSLYSDLGSYPGDLELRIYLELRTILT